ncbi:TonB-dependent receptor domain-containing protein [Permianibacter fluminis]|uniref:TonB-dependent receptor domain-containing protein n=1 Tax=Permianibacter fluminis TaxID=2738515 RepID=UPI001B7D7EC3|nr:TonB-dependent receptor [Permianibacter fluminis]
MKMSRLSTALLAACGASLLPTLAFAADETQEQAERVEITGSRIKRTDTEGAAPVMTLTRETLEKAGVTSIGEVLQQLTTGGKALNGKFNSSGNFGYPPDNGGIGAGSAQVDLRHLGSKRVLVLVDGQRWVNESSGSGVAGAVDLNTIPMAIVERIEVLEDGASSIYGSDAIAGVVNVITRKDFDGLDIQTYYGQYDKGDGETEKAEITIGGGNDKFHAVFSASYNNQKEISSGDRAISRTTYGADSSRGYQGYFNFCDPNIADPDQLGSCAGDYFALGLDRGTGNISWDPNDPFGGSYHDFGSEGYDFFNYAPYNLLLTPNKRKSIFTSLTYELSSTTQWYMKALYNTRESANQAAPEPISLGVNGDGLSSQIVISALNPYNPFGIDLVPGVNFNDLRRRPLEGGPRVFEQHVDTFYFNTGFKGSFGDYDWDLNYIASSNRAEQDFFNSFNLRKIQIALGDPDVCLATTGCVPLNLFGGMGANGQGTITRDMLNWIQMDTKDSSEQTLHAVSANLSGNLFEMPAGAVGFAAGFEYRKTGGTFNPDQVRATGESNDSIAIYTSGSYDVKEVYAELRIPITENLELNPAIRRSDYSTFGSTTNGKISAKWNVMDDLLIRASYSEGFRAPFIGEMFGTGQFGATVTDPCDGAVDGSDGFNSNALEIACVADGVPDGFTQIDPQITTTTGGNPDLEPEESKSTTAGAVYSPNWARDLSWANRIDFELTYYKHEIDGAVQGQDPQNIVDRCINDGVSAYCANYTRNITGQISNISALAANVGSVETSGYDFRIVWALNTGIGDFKVNWATTYVDDYTELDENGSPIPRQVGIEVSDSAIPEIQSNVQTDWTMGDMNIGWTIRYIDSVKEVCDSSTPEQVGCVNNSNTLDATMYNDLQFGLADLFAVKGLRLNVGINNVLDEDAPTCYSCTLNGYDAGTYDLPGRFFYVQLAYRE